LDGVSAKFSIATKISTVVEMVSVDQRVEGAPAYRITAAASFDLARAQRLP
jgi:hypothetical protein